MYDYDVPLRALARKWYARFLPLRSNSYKGENRESYIPFRQVQHMALIRLYSIIGLCFDLLAYYRCPKLYPWAAILGIPYFLTMRQLLPYTLTKKDVRRLRQFRFRVVTGNPTFTPARRGLPRWITLTTLMDAFYWLGQSPIWHDDGGNILAYQLPDERKLTIRLKSAFYSLPESKDPYSAPKNTAIFEFIEDMQIN